jgi:hypothetical protein
MADSLASTRYAQSLDSRLFADNGWILGGRTKGYSRDPSRQLSRRVASGEIDGVSDNAGLVGGGHRWWVWVRLLEHPI